MPFPLPNYPYTEEQDAFLIANWGKLSARQIGEAIGNRTKNSVIGRAGRLNLPKMLNPATPRCRKEKPLKARETMAKDLKHVPIAKVTLKPLESAKQDKKKVIAMVARPTAFYSSREGCQFPTGESPNIRFQCRDPRLLGRAYCEAHYTACYTTQSAWGQATRAQADRVVEDDSNRAVEHLPTWKPAYGPLQLAASVETQDMTI